MTCVWLQSFPLYCVVTAVKSTSDKSLLNICETKWLADNLQNSEDADTLRLPKIHRVITNNSDIVTNNNEFVTMNVFLHKA